MASIACPLYIDLILYISCLSFLTLCCFFRSPRSGSVAPVNWPVVGMLPALVAKLHRLHDYLTDVLRGQVGFTFMFKGPWFLGMDFLVTCNEANVHHVFNLNFPNYPKGDDFAEICDVLGGSLFGADGISWRVQRKIAQAFIGNQAFRSSTFEATRNKVEHGLVPFLDRIAASGETVDVENVFSRVTYDITSVMIFGSDPATLSINFPDKPFADAIDDFWEAVIFRHSVPMTWWKLLRWLNMGSEKKMARANDVIDLFIAKQISQEREKGDHKTEAGLLKIYMDHPFEDVKEFFDSQDKFLRDTVLFLMIAGRDAFAIGISWLFWLLSKNPHVEAKIIEELRAHAKRKQNQSPMLFDVEDLGTMVYLHGAVCETLRLFPPVPIEHKSPTKADVLPSGHRVDPGMRILFVVYSMGRMEEIWGEDCMEFKPERWISQAGKIRHVPAYKFMAFNFGQRSCLGKEIGLTQLMMVAAAVLANFEVEVINGHVVEPKVSGMLRMKNRMRVNVKKRSLLST